MQHRLTSLLASYFDILFALNRLPHPGEKGQMTAARQYCSRLPERMEQDIQQLLLASALPDQWPSLLPTMDTLLDHLDALLETEGLLAL